MNWKKIGRTIIILLILSLGLFIYFHYYWVFGTGTKAGVLNYFMKKGYMFKTYEGKIIQSGFKQNVQSNEFEFSVTDDNVANILLKNSGKEVVVRYKEYSGALPWRGMQTDIVDSVLEIREIPGQTIISPQ